METDKAPTFSELALLIPCAYCGVQPEQRCVTRIRMTGRLPRLTAWRHYGPSGRSSYAHDVRTRAVFNIWRAGWDEAKADGAP